MLVGLVHCDRGWSFVLGGMIMTKVIDAEHAMLAILRYENNDTT